MGLASNAQTCLRHRIVVCALDASRASFVRDERPFPARVRSRGSGFRAGWPSYSHRPASIDPLKVPSTAASLSHRPRSPVPSNPGGQRLTALRVTDRPRLIGWSSLDLSRRRSLTSLVVIAGTAASVPSPTGSRRDARLATHATRLPARPRPPPCRPCGATGATIGTPSVVSQSTGLPR